MFPRQRCAPVEELFETERNCLQRVVTVVGPDGDRHAQAKFKKHPVSDNTFRVTVPSNTFRHGAVHFESIQPGAKLRMSKENFVKRAATLAFVTRLAVSIRPTTGDRKP
jgi:hypothetical protein